jgi:hypothetical protein
MMKYLTSIVATALIGFTANTSLAQVCISDEQQTTPTTRFSLEDDQVIDKRTGLIWQRCAVGQTWNAVRQGCDGESLEVNWKVALESAPEGWRVPNVKELISIAEYTCTSPSINLTVFPDTSSGYFWSSTPVAATSSSAQGMLNVYGIPNPLSMNSVVFVRFVKDQTMAK